MMDSSDSDGYDEFDEESNSSFNHLSNNNLIDIIDEALDEDFEDLNLNDSSGHLRITEIDIIEEDKNDDSNTNAISSRSRDISMKLNWGPPTIFNRFLRRNVGKEHDDGNDDTQQTAEDVSDDGLNKKGPDLEEDASIEAGDSPIDGILVKDDVDSKIVVCSIHSDNVMAQRRPFLSGMRIYHWYCPLCLVNKQHVVSDPQDFGILVGDLVDLYDRHYMEMEKSGVTQPRDLELLQTELVKLKEEAAVAESKQELDLEYLEQLLTKTLPKMEMLWQDPPKKQEPILVGKLISLRSDLRDIRLHLQKSTLLPTQNQETQEQGTDGAATTNAIAAAALRDVIQQMVAVFNDERLYNLLQDSEQSELDALTEEMLDWQDTLAVALVTIQNHIPNMIPETEEDIQSLLDSLQVGEVAATATTLERERLERRRRLFQRIPNLFSPSKKKECSSK